MNQLTSIKNKRKFFNCFSINLLRFLKEYDIKPIDKDVHTVTKRTFWVFVINNRLSYALTQWNKEKLIK